MEGPAGRGYAAAGRAAGKPTTRGARVHEQADDAAGAELVGAWRRVLEDLRPSMPDSTFGLWLEPLRVVATRGSTLYLSGPKKVRTWAERRYGDRLRAAIGAYAPETELRFIDERSASELVPSGSSAGACAPSVNPDHVFERFVIGPGNRLAHAAALAVAEAPAQAYNPLFLHGPPGLGKTHLLGAIANYLRHHAPDLRVDYATAESFTNSFVAALNAAEMEAFKARYRSTDVLLLDDVQFLEGKAKTADELFHTFNALHEGGAQIVLSADRMPSELSDLAQRLRDRFEWGLVTELRAPDQLTRLTYLNRVSREEELNPAEPEALSAIACHATANLRILRGALTRVVAVSSLTDTPITRGLVEEALPGAAAAVPAKAVGAEQIQLTVCAHFGVDREKMLSPSRAGPVVEARQLAMYLTRRHTELSLPRIARAFNRRDHTTVMHALKRVESRLATEPALAQTLDDLATELTGSTVSPDPLS